MKVVKVLNYITGVVAMLHAGTTSFFSQQIYQIPTTDIDYSSYEKIMEYANTLPAIYFVATSLMLLTGTILLILGIVTLVFNMRLDNRIRIKRIAIWTSLATIFGVMIGLTPVANTLHAVFLALLYIVSGYFIPQELSTNEGS